MKEIIENRNLQNIKGRIKEGYSWDLVGNEVLDALDCGVILMEFANGNANIIYHNETLCAVLGYGEKSETQHISDVTDFLCPRDEMALIVMSEQTLLQGKPMSIEVLGADENGNDNWIHISARPVDFVETDGVVALAVLTNVTLDKQKYLENTINYERYLMLQDAAVKSVYFEYDNKNDVMTFNYRAADGGIAPVEIRNYSSYAKKMNLIHPEDRELFFGALARACSKAQKGTFRYRTTIIDQQSYKWANNTYLSIADGNGSIVRLIGRIDDVDDEEKEKARTAKLIEYDSTTGVYNKLTAATKIQKAIEVNKGVKGFFAIVDLDDFKAYNDTHGHSFGDEVLLSVANDLNASFPDGIVGRFGGDEFILYVSGYEEEKVVDKFECYLKKLDNTIVRGEKYEIRCCIGVAWSDKGMNYAEYFDAADALLYKAKNSGKNKVICEKI